MSYNADRLRRAADQLSPSWADAPDPCPPDCRSCCRSCLIAELLRQMVPLAEAPHARETGPAAFSAAVEAAAASALIQAFNLADVILGDS